MQLCRKNNIIIIYAVEYKATIKEKNVHIEIPGLIGDQRKTHYGENLWKLFFFLYRHQMIQQKRVQWSIYLSMQQNNYNTHNMILNMLVLKELDFEDCNALLLIVVNYWIWMSLIKIFKTLILNILVSNKCRDTMCERLKLIWMLFMLILVLLKRGIYHNYYLHNMSCPKWNLTTVA